MPKPALSLDAGLPEPCQGHVEVGFSDLGAFLDFYKACGEGFNLLRVLQMPEHNLGAAPFGEGELALGLVKQIFPVFSIFEGPEVLEVGAHRGVAYHWVGFGEYQPENARVFPAKDCAEQAADPGFAAAHAALVDADI